MELEEIKQYLISRDPILERLFNEVDATGFDLFSVIKPPFVALVGAIIGQKISYKSARTLRGALYKQLGVDFTPEMVLSANLDFLGEQSILIKQVCQYILSNNVDLSTEKGIRSISVRGIGPWTIENTILTAFLNWDIFPPGDKFIQNRLKKLYGEQPDTSLWSPYRSVVSWYLWRWF